MAKKTDLKYICTFLGNTMGLPVRAFEKGKQTFFYSMTVLCKDPLSKHLDKVIQTKDHVGYFIAPHDLYYGILNVGENKIVVGPTRRHPLSEKELVELAFESDVPGKEIEEFKKGMKSLALMPVLHLMQTLCLLNHTLNNGEKLSLVDVSIFEKEQKAIENEMQRDSVQKTVRETETSNALHNTLDIEELMMNAVSGGDVDTLNEFFKNVPAIDGGVVAQNGLRQAKNIFVVTATLVSRAAIRGGMDVEEALTLSDDYIQKCELMTNSDSITNLNYRLIMDYAERMRNIRMGVDPTPLVVEVNNYVRKHLFEQIKIEKMAFDLGRGRSRLSTDFKKVTGENLSDFIVRMKIEEAKKMLSYSEKPIVDIAFYLGFSSQSHFISTFKKYQGCTPKEYRMKKIDLNTTK